MKSIVIEATNPVEMGEKVLATIQNGFEATLCLVFCAYDKDKEKIASFFKENNLQSIGCTTSGEIAMTEALDKQIVVMMMDMKTENFIIDHREFTDAIPEDTILREVAEIAQDTYINPSLLLFSCGVTKDHGTMVNSINEYLPKETLVYGGIAGGDDQFTTSNCFSSKGVIDGGVVTLIVNGDKVKLNGLAVSGWEGKGNLNVVTKAEGNKVMEINDEPALDFFCKHFGFSTDYGLSEDKFTMPGNFPMEMVNKNGFQRLRSIMSFDIENNSLILAAGVNAGDTFRFCLPPSVDVLDNSLTQFERMAEKGVKADAVVLISCMCRKIVFGPLIEHEVVGIQKIWDKPLVGFFSFGEIGRISDDDTCDIHNCTSNLLTITELN